MKCPVCHEGKMVADMRDISYTSKGESTVLPHVKGQFCSACDESLLNPAESRRTMKLMTAFNKQINGSI